MRQGMFAWLLGALLLLVAAPLSAQNRNGDADRGWWPWAGGDRGQVRSEDRYDRDDDRRGNGPPFCRNGQGHPTKGWRWCEEKGWASRGDRNRERDVYRDRDDRDPRDRRDDRWGEIGWEDVILRRPASYERLLDQDLLRDLLGGAVLGRLGGHAARLGARGALDGRMFREAGGSVLQLRAGGVPLAELTDLDRDGRFDLVLLARGG